jgi:hypothetical protein
MNSQYAQKAGCHGKFSPQAGIANYRRVAPTRQPNATYRTREYRTDAVITPRRLADPALGPVFRQRQVSAQTTLVMLLKWPWRMLFVIG